jgi:phosphoglycolate phosphatase
MPVIRGILFDKDGTLIDYAASWGPINLKAADLAAGGDADFAAYLMGVGGADAATGDATADSVLAAGSAADIASAWCAAGARFTVAALTERLDSLFLDCADAVVPVTDLGALFGRLKSAGLSLGIASSDNERSIRRMVEHLGLESLVDFVAGYDSGFGVKPGPGMAQGFCRACGLSAGELAVVGDNTHDLAMGRAAGAGLVIGVLTGTGTPASLSPLADACLASIADIEAVLSATGR